MASSWNSGCIGVDSSEFLLCSNTRPEMSVEPGEVQSGVDVLVDGRSVAKFSCGVDGSVQSVRFSYVQL